MSACIHCKEFPCGDVDKSVYMVPDRDIEPSGIKALMISECPPENPADYFYASGQPFHLQTTLQAFNDAGAEVSSMAEIAELGFYLTTAVKCAKRQYAVSTDTIKHCSLLLEKEVALFPDVDVFLLMGDVAIKAMNYIWKRQTGKRVIPAGSTYKIRSQAFYSGEKRVFPSYVQTGKNYLIEKSKRKMIAEDIRRVLEIMGKI